MPPTLRLVTWNVNKRRNYRQQADYLAHLAPDIVALQEVAFARVGATAAALADLGLPHCVSTGERTPRDLTCDVLIASRWPLTEITLTTTPLAQSLVSARTGSPFGPLEIHDLHAPTFGTYGEQKLATLEAVRAALAVPSEHHRVLLGDLNTPRAETSAGEVITFGQRVRKDGAVRVIRGHERVDAAERGVLEGLREFGFRDAFRSVHGYGVAGVSWRSHHANRNPFRLDHAFVSAGIEPLEARYHEEVMTPPDTLSDHAVLEIVIGVGNRADGGASS